MDYVIEYGDSMDNLEARVRTRIAQGWVPQGGLALNGSLLIQALVRLSPPTPLTVDAINTWRRLNGIPVQQA